MKPNRTQKNCKTFARESPRAAGPGKGPASNLAEGRGSFGPRILEGGRGPLACWRVRGERKTARASRHAIASPSALRVPLPRPVRATGNGGHGFAGCTEHPRPQLQALLCFRAGDSARERSVNDIRPYCVQVLVRRERDTFVLLSRSVFIRVRPTLPCELETSANVAETPPCTSSADPCA
ncbi:hypothetical protein L227DRAFT_303074 [Lentinus tigrinus ALCF2SS1-6]|uniref:Uncharacterized protein n=1 Tax=Lentinus tigrinus ALCF2SS1-6 TaxID=1328759 RepID=A0A5C2RVH9_9APHY|nr:hypothetical protein L227DRAFT_303074 [Lentinus tigrinus ALCF2SS1-6]